MKLKQEPYFFLLNGKKHLNFEGTGPRFWTKHESPTHYLKLNRTPDFPECIGCTVEFCKDEEEAKRKVHDYLKEKAYGKALVYTNKYNHTFCYAVHFPRFKSEGDGFINFHCVSNIHEANKIPVKIDYDKQKV
jgi:hypothetical protein